MSVFQLLRPMFLKMIRCSSGCGTKVLYYLITSSHRATERPANADVCFARAFLAQHRIKRDQLEDVDRLKSELGRDPRHRIVVNQSEMFLPKMQQRQRGASFLIGRIMPDGFIYFSLQLGGNAGVHGRKS